MSNQYVISSCIHFLNHISHPTSLTNYDWKFEVCVKILKCKLLTEKPFLIRSQHLVNNKKFSQSYWTTLLSLESLRLNSVSCLCHYIKPTVALTANVSAMMIARPSVSNCQGLESSGRFMSFLRWLSFFFISRSICSKDMSSFLLIGGGAAWPWKALSVYLASRPSVKRREKY